MQRYFIILLIFLFQYGAACNNKPAATPALTQKKKPKQTVVYITDTGKKYPEAACRWLKKSKIAISLDCEVGRGYEACKSCKPPIK